MTRNKRRSEKRNPVALMAAGAIVVAIAIGFVAFGLVSVTGIPGANYQTLYADIPAVGNLRAHDEVRVAGVRVGQIIDIVPTKGRVRVELQLAPGTGRFASDTAVAVRARGLLGSRYLELIPGTSSRLLAAGATIRGNEASLTNGVSDVLDTFDRQTRGRLGDMLGGLGQGLLARGQDLNDTIRIAPGLTDELNRVADSIEAREGAARRFVPSVGSAMASFDLAREDIARGFGATADGLDPFIESRRATQATLTEAPPTLTAIQSGLGEGRRLLASARSLSNALDGTLPEAPRALRGTTALMRGSDTALRRADSLLAEARPTVPAALAITDALEPNLEPLRRAFSDLQPIFGQASAHACDIKNFGDNWRSVLGYGAPSERNVDGIDAGPYNQFRIEVIASGASAGNLLSDFAKPFVQDREIYSKPCTFSPGPTYDPSGLDAVSDRSKPR